MIFKLLSRLPFPVLYLLSDFLYLIGYHILRYRKKIVYENIRRSFSEKSDQDVQVLVKHFYRNLADVLVETVKALSIKPETLKKRFNFTNPELLEEYFKKDQSVIVMAAHQGNWEWLLLGCCVYLSVPLSAVYKKLNNTYFEKLMMKARSRFGGQPIPMERTLMEIVRRKKEVTAYGIVADQVPLVDAEKYWTKFLSQDTAFFIGTEKIAQLTGYPVLFLSMKRIRRGHYQGTLDLLAEPPYEKGRFTILEKYACAVEKSILADPSGWLWSHRRWKYPKENTEG